MKRIVLISCVSKKGNKKTKAKDLYKGPLFTNSLTFAEKLNPDNIFILSAKYGLVDINREIEPYDVTLSYVSPSKRMNKPDLMVLSKAETDNWGLKVLKQLRQVADLDRDEFIILAGQSYIKPIQNGLTNILEPLKGLKQGERVNFLKEHNLL